MPARQVGRLGRHSGGTPHQWAQSRPDPDHVVAAQRTSGGGEIEGTIDRRDQVVDVDGVGDRRFQPAGMVGVGGADVAALTPGVRPGDHEDRATVTRAGNGQRDPVTDTPSADGDVDPLGWAQRRGVRTAFEGLHVVGPDPRRVDHHSGADLDRVADVAGDVTGAIRPRQTGRHRVDAPHVANVAMQHRLDRHRLTITAPKRSAAVRSTARVRRASSTWASWYR